MQNTGLYYLCCRIGAGDHRASGRDCLIAGRQLASVEFQNTEDATAGLQIV